MDQCFRRCTDVVSSQEGFKGPRHLCYESNSHYLTYTFPFKRLGECTFFNFTGTDFVLWSVMPRVCVENAIDRFLFQRNRNLCGGTKGSYLWRLCVDMILGFPVFILLWRTKHSVSQHLWPARAHRYEKSTLLVWRNVQVAIAGKSGPREMGEGVGERRFRLRTAEWGMCWTCCSLLVTRSELKVVDSNCERRRWNDQRQTYMVLLISCMERNRFRNACVCKSGLEAAWKTTKIRSRYQSLSYLVW